MTEGLTALLIHLVVPLVGLAGYAMLAARLRQQGASVLFLGQLFFIFLCWGGLLVLVLTSLFWRWSGMASLGAGFLFFIAPLLMGGTGFCLAKVHQPSVAQRRALWACSGYFAGLAVLLAIASLAR